MVITAIATYRVLLGERRGFRSMEVIIGSFVALIGLCYLVELLVAPVDWGGAALGLVLAPDCQAPRPSPSRSASWARPSCRMRSTCIPD